MTDSSASLSQSLGMALIATGRLTQQRFEAELEPTGLSMRHLGALGHLVHDSSMSISDLARMSGVTAQSMHATVRGLQERGAVTIEDSGRGRPARLAVTAHGRSLLAQAREAAARTDALLAELFGAKDAATMQRILSSRRPASRAALGGGGKSTVPVVDSVAKSPPTTAPERLAP